MIYFEITIESQEIGKIAKGPMHYSLVSSQQLYLTNWGNGPGLLRVHVCHFITYATSESTILSPQRSTVSPLPTSNLWQPPISSPALCFYHFTNTMQVESYKDCHFLKLDFFTQQDVRVILVMCTSILLVARTPWLTPAVPATQEAEKK
jgi:hypothetical protein